MIWQANAYGQNILQLLTAASLQFFTQAHKISVLLMEEILHHFQRPNMLSFTVFFGLASKNTGICSVLCISSLKSIGIYSSFCVFALFPQKTLKRKNAVFFLAFY